LLVDFAENVSMHSYTVENIKKTLFEAGPIGEIKPAPEWTSEYLPWEKGNKEIQRKYKPNKGYELLQGKGTVRGKLIGGCLEVFDILRGTPVFPTLEDFDDAILFLETSEEKPPVWLVECGLRNYGITGVLDRIRGIIWGKPQDEEYYDEYKRTNQLLVELTDLAVSFLTDKGFKAVSGRATKEQIDLRYLAAPLPLKTIASKSGLGWVGKSALLVTKQYGSAVRLSGVLTDAELPVADPIVESSCGDCRDCVDACPGHAFTGNQWKAGIDRDELYGCYLCRAAALEQLSRRTGIIDTVCGICVAVCPWTRRYADSATASSQG
jgi:NAD-dependent dihydropyrimidine dehydrogenase PreA subunit